MQLILILVLVINIILPAFAESEPNCRPGSELKDGICVIENECEPDMYGNIYCPPPIEDSLTLDKVLSLKTNNLDSVTHISTIEILVIIIFAFLVIIIPSLVIIYYFRKSKRT